MIVPDTATRLYSKDELEEILGRRSMGIVAAFGDYRGRPDSAREILEWLGGPFNPDYFDLEEVNSGLKSKDYGCIEPSDE